MWPFKRAAKAEKELPPSDIIQTSCRRADNSENEKNYDWRLDFKCTLCGYAFWLGSTLNYKDLDRIDLKCPACSAAATVAEIRAFMRQELRKRKCKCSEFAVEDDPEEPDEEETVH